ncbi:MAG: hypothetical protein QOK38_143 [Acidobacteriaceae bacterium]|jgi:hypothetical protein|nr:hypothetical protein [Acidobacteriaceae bacterium]
MLNGLNNNKDRLIKGSRLVVRIAIVTNRLFLLAVVVGLLLSWIFSAQFAALLLQQNAGIDVQSAMTGLRLLMLLGIAMAVATDRLLAALAQIIASAGAGDPFISANARRLQTIGWTLLALQLLDIPGALLEKFFPSLGSAAPDVTFSPGGWIAVLMVFVLSRVFAAGSAMRDELEGTV